MEAGSGFNRICNVEIDSKKQLAFGFTNISFTFPKKLKVTDIPLIYS